MSAIEWVSEAAKTTSMISQLVDFVRLWEERAQRALKANADEPDASREVKEMRESRAHFARVHAGELRDLLEVYGVTVPATVVVS